MHFSDCSINIFEFTFFQKKCKQTAEISWLFFWDVKIWKKLFQKILSVFYPDVKTYLDLCGPSTQCEIAHFPDIHCRLFVVRLKRKKCYWKIQLILLLWCPFCFASIGRLIFSNTTLEKLDISTKPVENLKIFLVTLTKTLVCWMIVYRWYEFTLLTRALSYSQYWPIKLICNLLLKALFLRGQFHIKLTL